MLGPLADLIDWSGLPDLVRFSRWGYAAANTAHILGVALLVGAILPLDLRMLGAWRRVDHTELSRVLVPVAAAGLALAILAGIALFAARTKHYAGVDLVAAKLALVALGTAAALFLHARTGWWMQRAAPGTMRLHGALSLFCWVGALVAGRMIAYIAP